MPNQDRISELLKGEIHDQAMQQRARRRVEWMVAQIDAAASASGDGPARVLDVGCSQGAVSILAAQAGHEVVGIDNEADRIAYAKADLAREPADVQARVRFEVADAGGLPYDDASFDVVLFGEVIEHLPDPRPLLKELARVLKPGGTLVVTTPFGLSPHHDHRRTLYPKSLIELVGDFVTPVTLEVADRYLRLTGRTDPAGDTPPMAQLLAGVQDEVEATLYEVERAEYEGRQERLRLREQAGQLGATLQERDFLARKVERLEQALAGERERNATLRFQRDRYRHQATSLKARRWWRIGAALAEARRNPRKLLLLPLTLWKVVFGPGEKPKVPAPIPPGETAGEQQQDASTSMVSPTDTRPTARLEARYLLPRRARAVTDLTIAGVMDTFTESSLAPDCNLLTFRPDTWRAALEAERPHLLFVESAWKGNGGSWEFQVGSYSYPQSVGLPHLTALVEWCREQDVPTVFWNKEDPVHFDKFKEAARLFDVVLTTDADRIPAYKALDGLRAEVVAALPFAAQPVLHHPTHELADRDPRPVFGGTYYKNRHPERREQMERLLDAARPFDLIIYDRTHGQESDSVGFPERFAPHIQGGVPYDEMVRIYRRHRLFLNTNSVIASPTMFSRRVFELLACGTPVVSTPSLGVEQMFDGIVPIVSDEEGAAAAIRELLTDDDAWHRVSLEGIRTVLWEHTYQHRLARVAAIAGYEVTPWAQREAAVLLLDDGRNDLARALVTELVAGGYELPLLVGTPDPSRFDTLEGVTSVHQAVSDPAAQRLRRLAEEADTPFVVVADPLARAAAIVDLVVGLRLTAADGVGFRFGGPAWQHVDAVANAPIALPRRHVAEHGWDPGAAADARCRDQLARAGIRPYSLGDPGNRVAVRAA